MLVGVQSRFLGTIVEKALLPIREERECEGEQFREIGEE